MAYPLKDYHPIFNKDPSHSQPSVCRQMINTCFTYVKWDTHNPANFVAAALHRSGVDTQALTQLRDPTNGLANNYRMQCCLRQAADQLARELSYRMEKSGARPIPLTYEGACYVIDRLAKTQPKQKIIKLRQIAKEIPWEALHGHGLKVVKKSQTTIFIKNEAYPGKDKPPRMIFFPQEGEKLLMSMCFYPLMHAMFSSKYCTKEIPEHFRPKAIEFRLQDYPKKFVADYTSFECVPNRMIMRLGEHRVYRHLIPREYWFLLDKIESGGTLRARNGVTIKTPAVQFSGRYNTSLSNTIRNKLLMDSVSLYIGQPYKGVFEGDDSLTSWPKCVSQADIEVALGKLGVAVDMAQYEKIGSAGYCSMYWNDNYELVCDPIKVLATFPFSNSQLATQTYNYEPLLSAKAMSLAFRAPGCPIVSAVVRRYIGAHGYMETRNEYERRWFAQFTRVERRSNHKRGMNVNFTRWDLVKEPTMSQRLFFEDIFNISPTDQAIIEHKLLTEDGISVTVAKLLEPAQNKCGVIMDHLIGVYHEMRTRALLLSTK